MKTYTLKAKEIEPQWHVRDAEGRVLGRLASEVAQLLRGKHRPTFSPHMDHGDYVVVVNAGKVKVTGNKAQQKVYYRHSGYPGGLKETLMARMLETHPERVMQRAVKGMLPHNRLSRRLMRHLKIYGGPDHPHEAQVNAGSRQRKSEAAAEQQASQAKAKAGAAETEAKAEVGEESA